MIKAFCSGLQACLDDVINTAKMKMFGYLHKASVFSFAWLCIFLCVHHSQKGKRQLLGHQGVLLGSACVDLFSAGPCGSSASCIIGYKGTRDIFLPSEGVVVVPFKRTSTRLFN